MIGLNKDIVKLCAHDNIWQQQFEGEKQNLIKVLGDYALDIQHVGSTALPQIVAKPIIDIAVAVKDLQTLRSLEPILTKAGYDVKNSIDTNGELLARKGTPDCRTHYIHIELVDSERYKNHILFRDYLLNNRQTLKEYEKLKKQIYKQHKDRKTYTALKEEFITSVLNKAKAQKQ